MGAPVAVYLPPWSKKADPERKGADVYLLDLGSDGYFIVSEAGVAEWRWSYCNDDGNIIAFGKVDYDTPQKCQEAAQLYAAGHSV